MHDDGRSSRASIALVACLVVLGGCPEAKPPGDVPRPTQATPAAEPTSCPVALARLDQPRVTIDGPLEDHVCQALHRALLRVPAPHRRAIGALRVKRAPSLGVPPDANLALQVLDNVALAVMNRGVLTITDAGALGARWRLGDVSREEVSAFLAGLADVLGVPAADDSGDDWVDGAWKALVARVDTLPGATLGPTPPVGAATVFDAIVRHGTPVMFGNDASLEEVLIHELGHAVQQSGDDGRQRLGAFATLSGWAWRDWAPGLFSRYTAWEDPLVLVRLLLADERGDSGVSYTHAATAGFASRYGRWNPVEDWAESYRVWLTDPDRLLKAAPDKALAMNALGWSARRDPALPGPLLHDASTLSATARFDALALGARRLLGLVAAGSDMPAGDAVAILSAHASLLARLPAGALPTVEAGAEHALSVDLGDGRALRPRADLVDEALARRVRARHGTENLQQLLARLDALPIAAVAEAGFPDVARSAVASLQQALSRALAHLAIARAAKGDNAADLAAATAELDGVDDAGRRALLLVQIAGQWRRAGSSQRAAAALERARELASKAERDWSRARAWGAMAVMRAAWGERAAALALIEEIDDGVVGRRERAHATTALAEAGWRAGDHAETRQLLTRAQREARALRPAQWRDAALANVARVAALTDDLAAAQQAAADIGERHLRVRALVEAARATAPGGPEGARALLRAAERLVTSETWARDGTDDRALLWDTWARAFPDESVPQGLHDFWPGREQRRMARRDVAEGWLALTDPQRWAEVAKRVGVSIGDQQVIATRTGVLGDLDAWVARDRDGLLDTYEARDLADIATRLAYAGRRDQRARAEALVAEAITLWEPHRDDDGWEEPQPADLAIGLAQWALGRKKSARKRLTRAIAEEAPPKSDRAVAALWVLGREADAKAALGRRLSEILAEAKADRRVRASRELRDTLRLHRSGR